MEKFNWYKTKHIVIRGQQRGVKQTHISIAADFGEETSKGLFMSNRAVNDATEMLMKEEQPDRQLIEKTRKLRGKYLGANDNGGLTTLYHPTKEQEKKIMRKNVTGWKRTRG